MCGIVGLLSRARVDEKLLSRMAWAIAHRGPDDGGVWIDADAGVGFGHRRLSIVDLSPHGHQPMASADGRWVVSFNGEIYNHCDLRKALEDEGRAPEGGWRGHSDTETLIECIAHWGVLATIERSVGMFAMAMWDRSSRQLYLCRDRFGEKPLFYGWVGQDFVFASELKAIRVHPNFAGEVDRQALTQFAAKTAVPAPWSIYRGLFKLPPGTILTVAADRVPPARYVPPVEEEQHDGLRVSRYWSYRDVVAQGLADPICGEAEAYAQLEKILAQSIRDQAVADVPVGAFLSGGIDSSAVVALYQKYSPKPVRTYTIGFEEAGFDEATHAKAVAAHLGTIHSEQYLRVKDAQDVIPLLPAIYDEPFGDSSQIPTYLVSKFAKQDVTVVLTGDGGDELFGGYNRHLMVPGMWNKIDKVPRAIRSIAGAGLTPISARGWDFISRLALGKGSANGGAKLFKGVRVAADAASLRDVYDSFMDEWHYEKSPVIGASELDRYSLGDIAGASDALLLMYWDSLTYLPDDILTKVDRATMAVSLEGRVPYLDHRVAQIAARIPTSSNIRGKTGKLLLRKILYDLAPRQLFERPKAGFAVPVGQWIKGPLRPWAEELFDPKRLSAEGYFDAPLVRQRWDDHLSGRRDSTPALWSVLMFQSWLAHQK